MHGSMKFPQIRQLKYWFFLKMQLEEHTKILLQNIVRLLIYERYHIHWNNSVRDIKFELQQ